jgi:alkylation response protein AidB-like acyl-CoA dehydrogenase
MDLNDTPEEAAFRAKARAWLTANAPRFVPPNDVTNVEGFELVPLARAWQALKAEAGFACISWPRHLGGGGGTEAQELIFDEEQRQFPLPVSPFRVSLGTCIATVIANGTAQQIERFVRPAVRGDEVWCQLFSEPSAGSDLAGIRTRAEKDGDEWVVNGQKMWTTGGHIANWGLLIARTDPTVPKYDGLTYFYVDMKSPGLQVRPIRQASGHRGFNEVFLTNVRIPDHQRFGAVGEGWRVATSTLMNERFSVNEADIANVNINDVLRLARAAPSEGGLGIDNAQVRAQLASFYARSCGVRHTRNRLLTGLSRNEEPGPEASICKLVLASNLQAMARLAMDLYGLDGVVTDRATNKLLCEVQEGWFWAAGLRIAGGPDEILRNIIAERVLGLPKEPRIDRNIPFNQLKA